jgi:spermidine/putrescine-binding protein
MVMLGLGLDPSNCSLEDAQVAADTVASMLRKGKAVLAGADYPDPLVQGKVAAGLAWSTDFARIRAARPQLRFMIPDDGCMIWSDDMLIPTAAVNLRNAHAWMDWYGSPAVAAKVTEAVRYTSPFDGVRSAIASADPSNPLVQGTPGVRTDLSPADLLFVASRPHVAFNRKKRPRMHVFRGLQREEERAFTEVFTRATQSAPNSQ